MDGYGICEYEGKQGERCAKAGYRDQVEGRWLCLDHARKERARRDLERRFPPKPEAETEKFRVEDQQLRLC